MWLQNGNHGLLANTLGVILLIAAAVTILRPDKPGKPPSSPDPAELADSNDDPLKAAQ